MKRKDLNPALVAVLLAAAATHAGDARDTTEPPWARPMRAVHERFKGKPGTFAHFGDSITVTLAFWSPLLYDPKRMSAEMAGARDLVVRTLRKECWRDWKGPEYGNQGRMTIRWADENVEAWLKKLDPEVVLILFGSNDMGEMGADEYERLLRSVVRRCLENGSVVILTTPPPRSGMLAKAKEFAGAVRRVAADLQVPLVDYQAEILKRRPDDWDGSLPQFKASAGDDPHQVPTLIAADGVHPSNPAKYSDYSEESLRHNGYALRNYLTLLKYAEVLRTVVGTGKK